MFGKALCCRALYDIVFKEKLARRLCFSLGPQRWVCCVQMAHPVFHVAPASTSQPGTATETAMSGSLGSDVSTTGHLGLPSPPVKLGSLQVGRFLSACFALECGETQWLMGVHDFSNCLLTYLMTSASALA